VGRVVRGRRGAAGSSGGRGAGFGEGVGVWEWGPPGGPVGMRMRGALACFHVYTLSLDRGQSIKLIAARLSSREPEARRTKTLQGTEYTGPPGHHEEEGSAVFCLGCSSGICRPRET